jgi:putative glutamine amidotransferase
MKDSIVIGITFSTTRFEFYPRWVIGNDRQIRIVLLAAHLSNAALLDACDAVVLTGGTDIHPSLYNSERLDYPHAPKDGWDNARDYFEQAIFKQVLIKKMPVLAICRGLQLVNASLGGTLLADLEESGKNNHRRMPDADGEHMVQLTEGSQLAEIAQAHQAMINSAHHQAVDRVADELKITGFSPDEVVEALEWTAPANRSPLLAVQWHPERVEQADAGTLSIPIRNWLLHQAQVFHENK